MSLRVCIIPLEIKGYRFFVGLAERLSQVGITLQVDYGPQGLKTVKRKVLGGLVFGGTG